MTDPHPTCGVIAHGASQQNAASRSSDVNVATRNHHESAGASQQNAASRSSDVNVATRNHHESAERKIDRDKKKDEYQNQTAAKKNLYHYKKEEELRPWQIRDDVSQMHTVEDFGSKSHEERKIDRDKKKDEYQYPTAAKKNHDHYEREKFRLYQIGDNVSQFHTLENFGYKFNKDGQLRDIETNSPFVFEVAPNDHSFNQRYYEELGRVITEYVFGLLETDCNLRRMYIPIDATFPEHDPRTFIFVSENVHSVLDSRERNSDKKLLVLIHGSGSVRAGQWARSLIINKGLNEGTMIPYINRAKEEGYEVMLLNTNHNSENGRTIKGSSSPGSHAKYVWEHFISKWPGKVAIVAHSAGGYVTLRLATHCAGFIDKVFAVAFTDSMLSPAYSFSSEVKNWLKKHCKNWVSSSKALDTQVDSFWWTSGGCPRVSAGTTIHELTSYFSMDSIFRFFGEMERVRGDIQRFSRYQQSGKSEWRPRRQYCK